eukprot:4596290-Pleurochrysis_carterae.AAC.3
MSALLWCNPNKNRTHDLKPEARLDIREISAITEGIKTELFKNAVKINEGGITRMSLINSLKREDSQARAHSARKSMRTPKDGIVCKSKEKIEVHKAMRAYKAV